MGRPDASRERIRRATLEVVRPTLFAQLIIIAAYLPIFMLQRVEGRIFSPMANTVVSALVGAMIFSVTLAPVLASFVYARGTHKESAVLRWAAALYEPTLRFALRLPKVAVGGLPVSVHWEGERKFDIVLRLPTVDRDDIEKISKLRVPTGDGTTMPLEAMAHVTTCLGRAAINRENGRRYIGVRMNIRGRDMGSFVEQARAEVAAAVKDAPGIQVEWGGEFQNKERAMKRLVQVVPVALILTLLLLFKAFDSFGRAVVTMLDVPFALVGGVFGLWLMSMPLSVAAAVGFIALIGQASLNGVLVTSAITARRAEGLSLDEAILQGCRERLRPVLMTAALAALGLVPAVVSKGIGSETQKPLAVVIVFGTLSAFALTMVRRVTLSARRARG